MLPDERPLPDELESFLGDGEPPVHFGLGSMPAPGRDVSELLVHTARALGRRAIISGGWADLSPAEGSSDCLVIGDTNPCSEGTSDADEPEGNSPDAPSGTYRNRGLVGDNPWPLSPKPTCPPTRC